MDRELSRSKLYYPNFGLNTFALDIDILKFKSSLV